MPVPLSLNIKMRLSAFELVMLMLVSTATATRYSLSVSASSFIRKDKPEQGKADHFKSLMTSLRFESSMKKPIKLESTPFPDELKDKLQRIYEGHLYDAMQTENRTANSINNETKKANVEKRATIYGELKPETLKDLLSDLRLLDSPPRRFYDLGCGNGKLVHTAWLLGLNATGVELIKERFERACTSMKRARGMNLAEPNNIRLLHGSIVGYDFSDADLVFVDSVTWPESQLQQLAKTAENMKAGSYIVSAHRKSFPGDRFQIVKNFVGPASWSSGQTWTIQKVIKEPETSSFQQVSQNAMSPKPLEPCKCDV